MRSDFASGPTKRIEDVCHIFGLTRDAWYKQQKRVESKKEKMDKVIELVQKRRGVIPFEGIKKLHLSIKPEMDKNNIKFGRDALWALLSANDMLVKRKKKYARTTDSNHAFNRYVNLISGTTPQSPNEIWASDITYIATGDGFLYLALITDAFSRKIIGYDISDSLEMLGPERALKMAIKQRKNRTETIHHSDHGVQYCCHKYVNKLKKNGIKISMGEVGNCYENAMAERVNGILKEEFKLDAKFKNKQDATKATVQSISLYNKERLHMKIGYKTPEQKHKNAA